MIAGPNGVFICDQCVDVCTEIIEDELGYEEENAYDDINLLKPEEIKAFLDDYVIGQDEAKRNVAVALRNRYRRSRLPEEMREEIIPKNIIMVGPTGVGKTELCKQLAQVVYGSQDALIRVDMSEYLEPSSAWRASGLCRLRRRRNAHGKGAPPSILRCTVR